jgi:outer membrane protein with beta-barrel domain
MRATIIVALLLPAAAARADHTLSQGIRGTAQHIAPEGDENDAHGVSLGGGGVQVRWRMVPALSLEVSFEGLHGELANGNYVRDSGVVTLSALWHIFPHSDLDLYALLGVGGTSDDIRIVGAQSAMIEQKFEETHVHLGIGLERLWTHWGAGVELRAVGLARKDQDVARDQDAVPPGSSGIQGSMTLGYYF